MRPFLYVVAFLFCGFSNAQESSSKQIIMKYEMLLSLNKLKKYDAVLYYDNNKSYFHWNNTSKKDSDVQANDFGNYEFEIVITDSIGTINKTNYLTNRMFTRELQFKDVLLLNEKKPEIQWQLKSDTKKIGNYICNKAIGKFRGRIYTVWYTPEIPLPIGPWKLQGLSGAIIEAYDQTKTVQFYLTSLKTVDMDNRYDYSSIFSNGKNIDIIEYEKKQSSIVSELIKKLKSKVPRGVQISVESSSQNFLEKEF